MCETQESRLVPLEFIRRVVESTIRLMDTPMEEIRARAEKDYRERLASRRELLTERPLRAAD